MAIVPGAGDLERKNQYWIDLGIRAERERIIKLLADLLDQSTWTNTDADYPPEEVERIIALIKGENK